MNRLSLQVKHRKGVSEMLSYVLLIMIAVGISVLVYAYLQVQVPKSLATCKEDVSLVLIDYNCTIRTDYPSGGKSGVYLSTLLENKGRYTVDAAYVRMGAAGRTTRELALNEYSGSKGKDDVFFGVISDSKSGLLPGKKTLREYSFNTQILAFTPGENIVEIQPATQGKGEKLALCEKGVVTQKIMCSRCIADGTKQDAEQCEPEVSTGLTCSDLYGEASDKTPVPCSPYCRYQTSVCTGINQPPTLNIISPTSGATGSVGDYVTVLVSASDSDIGDSITVEMYDGNTRLEPVQKKSDGNYQYSPSSPWKPSEGTHIIKVIVTDNAGLKEEKTTQFTIGNPAGTGGGSSTLQISASPSSGPAGSAITLSGTVSDPSITAVIFYRKDNNNQLCAFFPSQKTSSCTMYMPTDSATSYIIYANDGKVNSNEITVTKSAPVQTPTLQLSAPSSAEEGNTVSINVDIGNPSAFNLITLYLKEPLTELAKFQPGSNTKTGVSWTLPSDDATSYIIYAVGVVGGSYGGGEVKSNEVTIAKTKSSYSSYFLEANLVQGEGSISTSGGVVFSCATPSSSCNAAAPKGSTVTITATPSTTKGFNSVGWSNCPGYNGNQCSLVIGTKCDRVIGTNCIRTVGVVFGA